MSGNSEKINRREQILQALAQMLESSPGQRITTAKLAAEVGVSEAALYRHFPSKARMYEGLIEFIDSSIMSRINTIANDNISAIDKIYRIVQLVLVFAEKNPGISRLLIGDALQGENDRLRDQINQIFDKIESNIKQTLRLHALENEQNFHISETVIANLILAMIQGKIIHFVRSNFKRQPSEHLNSQWQLLHSQLEFSMQAEAFA